jgi:hypothetical protein
MDAVQSQCFIAPICKRDLKHFAVGQERKKHFMSAGLSNKRQHSSVRRLYHSKTIPSVTHCLTKLDEYISYTCFVMQELECD